jgi:hypothetical protein
MPKSKPFQISTVKLLVKLYPGLTPFRNNNFLRFYRVNPGPYSFDTWIGQMQTLNVKRRERK